MKGKVAFVLGAAVGYVLGTRAGRERYAQIKRGAKAVWGTPPVQRGVTALRGVAQTQVDRAKDAALQAGKNLINGGAKRDASTGSANTSSANTDASSSGAASTGAAQPGGTS